MNKRNMKRIFSLILIAIMLTGSITPTFAAVTHYVVEKEGVKYQYSQEDLIESYYGDKKLYNNYLSGKLQALLDDKNGYIDAENVFKYIANTEDVYVNNYTESKEAKVIEVGNVINLDSDGNPIEDYPELKVVEVSAIDAKTISVIFEGIEKAVEIELEEALVHGENEVTFEYNGQKFTVTVEYVAIALPKVISVSELNEISNNKNVVIFDLRSQADYEAGHIPGALNINNKVFEDPDNPIDGEIATPEQLEALMSDYGLKSTDIVIAYSQASRPQMAPRLVWTLGVYDHTTTYVLDGHYEAWVKAGLEVEEGPQKEIEATEYKINGLNEDINVDSDYVLDIFVGDPADGNIKEGTILLDIRPTGQYTGEDTGSNLRNGHIPGAVNVPYMNAVDENGFFLSTDELKAMYAEVGITGEEEVIIYCQRGHRASHSWLVLNHILGFENIKVYDGSMMEWANNPELPMVEWVETVEVESVSAIDAKTISVIFEGSEKAVEIELEEALVHGQTKVTFVYEEVEYTATLKEAYIDPSQVAYVASDFTYEGSTITGFSEAGLSKFETKKNVNLPDKSTDGTTIKAIGENAFKRDDFISGTDEFTSPNGIKTLVLPASLVEIGIEAFRYNALEGEIVFPETLEKIGNFAFFGNRITEVNLPDSVTEIGISSFATNKIEKVNTSVNMKSIASGAFTRNLMLSEVTLHEGLERIEASAFHSSNLTQLTIPPTVTFIGRDAFYGHDLSSVEIPASVETIDRGAFQQKGATTLENVILKEGLKKIGQQAFADANISQVKLPSSLETLDYRAFKGNPGVVKLYSDNPAHLKFNEQKDAATTQWVELTEVVEEYVASDFNYGLMNFKPVMQPERQIFVITGFSEKGMEKSQRNGDLVIPKTVEIEESGEHTTKSVEGIDREAFKGVALKSVVFPETIGEYDFVINSSAFANSGLEEVTFNEGIKAIKEGAFTNNNLTEVYFPSTITTIGNNSFAHNNISNLVFSDDVVAIQIDNYTFYDNELKEVHLPYSIFKFLGYVFKGNPGTEPLSESELDANDPEGTGVVQIYTRNPVHLTSDTYIALSKYHNIVNVAEGIDRTDLYSTIQNAKSIVLSDYPQANIDMFLTELSIVKDVFKDEEATQKNIDDSLVSLTDAIKTLMASGNDKSNLRILIKEAKGYSSQVYTPETYGVLLLVIEEVESLLLDSTVADEEISTAEGKIRDAIDSLVIKLDIVFTKEDFIYEGNAITGLSSTGEEKFKHNKNLILPDESPDGTIIEVIGESAFQNVEPIWGSDTATPVGGIETVKLPSQLKRIEDSAFKYNSLEEVNFPETLEYIGSLAFNATLLKSVYLPDSVVELGQGSFSLNKITELRLSPNLTEIENGAFSRNLNLVNVELHEGLTRIGQSAFIGCPIKLIEFPRTLKTIGRLSFSASRLESVHIPSNVEVIETQAFKQNLKFRTLKEITFEEGLKSIGEGAFMDGMTSEVHLPHSLEKLGETAFAGNINANKESIIVKLHTTNEAHLNFETTKSKVHQQIILAAAPSTTYALTFNVKDEAVIAVEGATIQVKNLEGRVVEDLVAVERGEYTYTVSKEGYVNATGTILVSGGDVTIDVILLAEVVSEFEFDSSTGTITKYTGNNVNIVIPSEISGVPVKSIGKQVFAKKGIESVQIPEGVERIGTGSFIQNNLTTVTLPSTVKTIEDLAFSNNKSLIEINLNEGLETIGNQVFQNTPLADATIIIPSTVASIGDSVLLGQNIDQMIINGDENSASIKFGFPIGGNGLNLKISSPMKNAELLWNNFGCGENDNYVDLGTIEISANTRDELKAALENRVNIKIVGIYKAVDSGKEGIREAKPIPWDLSQVDMSQETITLSQKISLGNEYFPEMEGYTAPDLSKCKANNYYSITIKLSSEEVVSDFEIDEEGVITAYNGTQTELVIPDKVQGVTVTGIGDNAFNKKGLTSVEIPDTVITIGEYAFKSNELTSIRLPMSLETIKKGAFQNNTLGSLAVPSSVKTIGNTAFAQNKIEELSLPQGLETIEDGAFQANSLTELTIPGSVEVVTALSFSANSNLRSVVLEEGIREISANAFTNDKVLTGEIILPSTLEHLYTSAFKGTGVTSLYIKGDEDSSLIEIHSAISPVLADISFESPYKEAYIVFNASGNLKVDLGTIDYSGEGEDLKTYLQENLFVKESAYHVNTKDTTGKSDIMVLADIDWDLKDVDFSSDSVDIYGTSKDFDAEDLESKGEGISPPNPSGAGSKNTYKITINFGSQFDE